MGGARIYAGTALSRCVMSFQQCIMAIALVSTSYQISSTELLRFCTDVIPTNTNDVFLDHRQNVKNIII